MRWGGPYRGGFGEVNGERALAGGAAGHAGAAVQVLGQAHTTERMPARRHHLPSVIDEMT